MAARLYNFRQIMKDSKLSDELDHEQLVQYIKDKLFEEHGAFDFMPEDLSDMIVSIYECYEMSGYSISDLPKTHTLQPESLFIASNGYNSPTVNVKYSQLSNYMLSAVKDELASNGYLRTMAYEDPNHFALSSHCHDKLYTSDISCNYSDFIIDLSNDVSSKLSTLGIVSISSWSQPSNQHQPTQYTVQKLSILCPEIEYPSPAVSDIAAGALKFMSLPSMQTAYASKLRLYGDKVNIDIFSDDFDGWVFPNGTTFTCDYGEFPKAIAAFGNGNHTSFTVPNLDSFLYAVHDGQDGKPFMQKNQQQLVVGPHTHEISIKGVEGDLTLDGIKIDNFKVVTADPDSLPIPDYDKVPYFGGGAIGELSSRSTGIQSIKFQFDKSASTAVDMQTAVNDTSTGLYQPQCQLMPVLVYIGAKLYPEKSN